MCFLHLPQCDSIVGLCVVDVVVACAWLTATPLFPQYFDVECVARLSIFIKLCYHSLLEAFHFLLKLYRQVFHSIYLKDDFLFHFRDLWPFVDATQPVTLRYPILL